ncbi:MAG: hypothetical protein NVV59_12570 [Chitinophagaceae bacterium]|nr:hypothetical protein [Chitinophagaceae bacterium]
MKLIPILLIASACVAIAACSKDTFETKPKIEIVDYNSRDVVAGQNLNITLEYFDKEGDLGQGWITAILDRQNLSQRTDSMATILTYALPDFPPRDKGEILLRIPHNSLRHTTFENDTFLIHIFVVDREQNISDTITTEQIVGVRP